MHTPIDKNAKPVTVSYDVIVPRDFDGTAVEREANRRSHKWRVVDPENGDVACIDCDAGTHMKAANWPCGVDVPTETVTVQRQVHPAEAADWEGTTVDGGVW